MVVTIGLAQLLAGLGVAIPFLLGADFPPQQLPRAVRLQLRPERLHLPRQRADRDHHHARGDRRAVRRSFASRASASRSVRARRARTAPALLGVNVGFTHNVAWVIATLMASITLILRATILGLPLGSSLGPSILLRALTAAVIGRMERFTVMFLAACGLGCGRGHDHLEQGLGDAGRPRDVRDRDRCAPLPTPLAGVAGRGPGGVELAERGQRTADPPRAQLVARGQVGAACAAGGVRRRARRAAVLPGAARHQPRGRGRHLRHRRDLARAAHGLGG